MRRIVCTVFLILTAFSSKAQEQTGRRFAVVDLSSNFMREEPAYEAENGNQALMGTVVEIVGEKDYWRQIISPEPYKAWVNEMGLVEMEWQEIQAYIASPKYICTAEHTHIFSYPDINSFRISDLVMGGLVRQVTSPDSGQAGNDGGRARRIGKGDHGGKEKGIAAGREHRGNREGRSTKSESEGNREGRSTKSETDGKARGNGDGREDRNDGGLGVGRISTDANGEGRENDFLEVILPSGRRGWVLKDDVEDFHSWTVSRSFTAEDILHTAYRLIGIPYMWGGTSIGQVDCSGLTRLVFFMNGILLPRNSSQQAKVGENISLEGRRQAKVGENISLEGKLQAKVGEDVSMEGRRQAKVGEEVSLNALKPADLLFFGKPATEDSPERISHVAIYLGDGLYIHSSQKVRISSLDSSSEDYGGRVPFKARRILGHVDDGTGIISIAKSPHYFLQSE